MTTLLPTHHCFDDAAEYLDARVRAAPDPLVDLASLRLVHAVARFPIDQPEAGKPFAHAWCEERITLGGKPRAVVWHAALLPNGVRVYLCSPRAHYYHELRVAATTRYTLRQVFEENQRSGTYGPWRPEYLALVRGATPAP